jgi:transcription elongation GreA/GreB family factor
MKHNIDMDNTVPVIDMNAELPVFENPVEDEIMTGAKKEWKIGLVVFGVFVVMLGGTVWAYTLNNHKISEVSKSVDQKTSEISKSVDQQVSEPVVSVKPVYAIFNGSGISGAAGKLKAKIEAAGYEVVEVGNAETVQTGTTVEISNLVSNQKDEILQIIGTGEYIPLRDTSLKYSVKVIIGK